MAHISLKSSMQTAGRNSSPLRKTFHQTGHNNNDLHQTLHQIWQQKWPLKDILLTPNISNADGLKVKYA